MRFEGLAFEERHGIGGDEGFGVVAAVAPGDDVAGLAEARWPGGDVVGVGGEEVHPALAEEVVRHLFGGAAHFAGDGIAGDLDEHAAAHPLGEAGLVGLESGVALGVGEDGDEAGELELVEGFVELGG